MTNEEVIRELVDILLGYPMASPRYEALEFAIKAVKQMDNCPVFSDDEVKQPCIESPCVMPKRGKWIRITKNTANTQIWTCSECGRTVEKATVLDPDIFFPFCHCGADMKEADNE